MDRALGLIDEVDQRTNCSEEARGNETSQHGDKGALDVTMFLSCHLFNMGYSVGEVPNRDAFMVNLESLVEFTSSYEFTPLEDVVEKELVTSVKDFRDEKNRWLCIHPVSPEWQVDSVEQKSFCQLLKTV